MHADMRAEKHDYFDRLIRVPPANRSSRAERVSCRVRDARAGRRARKRASRWARGKWARAGQRGKRATRARAAAVWLFFDPLLIFLF